MLLVNIWPWLQAVACTRVVFDALCVTAPTLFLFLKLEIFENIFTYSVGMRKRNSLLLDHFYLVRDKMGEFWNILSEIINV